MLIVQMDWFALNLAIPAIARHFNVPATDLQWVVSGYMLSIGALMVTAGRLADIFGRRRVNRDRPRDLRQSSPSCAAARPTSGS
jgi:MFS family permease